jgi:hypothetical protein
MSKKTQRTLQVRCTLKIRAVAYSPATAHNRPVAFLRRIRLFLTGAPSDLAPNQEIENALARRRRKAPGRLIYFFYFTPVSVLCQ